MAKEQIASTASAVMYSGAGIGVVGGLTATEIASYGGLIIAFIGLLVNIIFNFLNRRDRQQHYKRIEEEMDDAS